MTTRPPHEAMPSRRLFLGGVLGSLALAACSVPGSRDSSSGSGAGGSEGMAGARAVTAFGGTTQEIYNKIVYGPFGQEHGTRVTEVTLQSDDALARMLAQKGSPEIDMFQFSGGQESSAKAQGLSTDIGDLGVDVDSQFVDPDGQWAAVAVIPEGIVYDTEQISEAPTSYRDFLRPEYRGHIAFPNITSGYGVDFLVMLAYAYGGSETDIDPGFEALAEIAAHAQIFQSAAEMQTLFSQGGVWLMPYDSSNAFRTAEAGLPVAFATPEEGSPANLITHVIADGSPNVSTAQAVVQAALQPDAQAQLAEQLRWIPVNPDTELSGEVADEVPVGQEALDGLNMLDREAIAEQRPEWTERFNREIAPL